eukprot:9500853-Pyramimonas_sp.AAC.1
MHHMSAKCLVHGSVVEIPAVDMVAFGFVCKDRSSLNRNRAKTKGDLPAWGWSHRLDMGARGGLLQVPHAEDGTLGECQRAHESPP